MGAIVVHDVRAGKADESGRGGRIVPFLSLYSFEPISITFSCDPSIQSNGRYLEYTMYSRRGMSTSRVLVDRRDRKRVVTCLQIMVTEVATTTLGHTYTYIEQSHSSLVL
jgi:hypothetical protein